MTIKETTYVGVSIDHTLRKFSVAAVDSELTPVSLKQGSLEEASAFIAGLNQVWVGVNAPAHLNLGLLSREEVKQRQPALFPGRPAGLRMAEFELLVRGVPVLRTPAIDQRCPGWIKLGFALYESLKSLGFAEYPAGDAEKQWMETHAEAVYHDLLKGTAFPAGTLEGRLQRQLGLAQAGLDLPDPMDFFEEVTRHRLLHGILPTEKIHSQAELDALAAAYTCWLAAHQPARVVLLGGMEEGQIVVPAFAASEPSPRLPLDSLD